MPLWGTTDRLKHSSTRSYSLSRHLFWIRRANIVLSARCCQQCRCCCCCRKPIARNYVCCTKCKWLFSVAVRRNYCWQVLSALFPNTTYSSLQREGVLLIRSIGPLSFSLPNVRSFHSFIHSWQTNSKPTRYYYYFKTTRRPIDNTKLNTVK